MFVNDAEELIVCSLCARCSTRKIVWSLPVIAILSLLLLFPLWSAVAETPKISVLPFDRPLWALSFNDAEWLLPRNNKDKAKTFAFFSFSYEKTNMPSTPVKQNEDNTGRTTRSLPIYLAERINVDSDCRAENHVFVVDQVGPVVSGGEWDIAALSGLFDKTRPDFIVTGHIIQDYLDLRATITLKVWDLKQKKEIIKIVETQFLNEPTKLAASVPAKFAKEIKDKALCAFEPSPFYPTPPAELISSYLDALGQLLMQTLAENKIVPASSLWGEEDMLNWYLQLLRTMPNSDATKLIFVRGVISSLTYGGAAGEKFVPILRDYLVKANGIDSVIFKVAPFVYVKLKNGKACEETSGALKKKASGLYLKWLNTIDCKV